jgi:hypothetical protein
MGISGLNLQKKGCFISLVPIRLSNATFLDIPYNILLLFHEISHYIPSDNKSDANKCLAEVFCNSIAERIVYKTISGNDDLIINNIEVPIDHLVEKLISGTKSELLELLLDCVGDQINSDLPTFGIVLLSKYHTFFSIIDKKNISDDWNCLVESLEEVKVHKKSESVVTDLKNIAQTTFELISCGCLGVSIQDLWDVSLKQLAELGSEKDCEILRENYSKLIKSYTNRQEEINERWQVILKKVWSPLLKEMKKQIKLQKPNNLIRHFQENHLLEFSEPDIRATAEDIILLTNQAKIKNNINETLNQSIKLFNEVRADFYMCKLLSLPWETYRMLVEEYMNKIASSITTENEVELLFRMQILKQTSYFGKQPIGEDFAKYRPILNAVKFTCFTDYLNLVDADIQNHPLGTKSLDLLKRYFKQERVGLLEESSDDIKLVEDIWAIGMKLA